jgi:hypothetical protein
MTFSKATIDAIDKDPACCRSLQPGTVGALPVGTSWGSLFSTLWPYIEAALQALLNAGIANPTPAQLLEKCHEISARGGIP